MYSKTVDTRDFAALNIHATRRATRCLIHRDGHSFRGSIMKLLVVTAMLGTSVTVMSAAEAADQTMDSDISHADTYVKDSVITTKVKAKLAEKHLATLTNIHVDTDRQGIVWLSGKAPTQDASDLAEVIAKSTEGVISVH